MITWTLANQHLPYIDIDDGDLKEQQLSKKVIIELNDTLLSDPITFGHYDHKRKEWVFQGYNPSEIWSKKVKAWSYINRS